MSEKESFNVVPFERPAAYWISRARKCKGRTRLQDAAPLLRQAYRQSGSDEIAIELTATYAAMGCITAAKRTLLGILTRTPEQADAYYFLGLTALAQHEEALGEDALVKSLKAGGASAYADDAQEILNNYDWHDEPVVPRSARAETLYQQALDALKENDLQKAVPLLQKSLKRTKTPRAAALLGEICLRTDQPDQAAALFISAVSQDMNNIPYALLLCEALCALSQTATAVLLLESLAQRCETFDQLTHFAQVCCHAGHPEIAKKRLQDALKTAPQSGDLMYILAAVRCAAGDTSGAEKLLHTILAFDPEDVDASAALRLVKAHPIPFERLRLDDQLSALCARAPLPKDAPLKRLLHGLTIALSGALSYAAVKALVAPVFARMNPAQQKTCDTSRLNLWQRAFYLYLTEKTGTVAPSSPLYKGKGHARQVRRMVRYIKANEAWGEIK